MNLEQKKRNRYNFLKHLYNVVDGDRRYMVNMWELSREIKLDSGIVASTVEYLIAEGLVEAKGLGGGIGITHKGVVEFEKSNSRPDESTEYFLPVNVINIENMTNSAIQQGNLESTQNIKYSEKNISGLNELIDLISEGLNSFELKTTKGDELVAEIETLKSQSKSPKPKSVIINESLKTIRSILEGVTANAIAPRIIELISGFLK